MTPTSHTDPDCPDLTLLEEYVLDRLDPSAMQRIKTHLGTCGSCAEVAQDLKEEADRLLETLSVFRGESTGRCVSEETLALYLDRALDGVEYTQTEIHLAECEACREQLVALQVEVSAVLGDEKLPEPRGSRVEFATGARENSAGTSVQDGPASGKEPAIPAHMLSAARRWNAFGTREILLPGLVIVILTMTALLVPEAYTIHLQTALVAAWSFLMWKFARSGFVETFEGSRAFPAIRGGTLLLSAILFGMSLLIAPGLSKWCLTASLMSFLTVLFLAPGVGVISTSLDKSEPAADKALESNAKEARDRQEESWRRSQGRNP
ncbi:MAG: zf-HC2 domain-containing protein [Candidatus Hydrogenedentes bacterium]|nr:zf-HC2 domain-containing protein [Candidatus Hydrogenedentota bacterium]